MDKSIKSEFLRHLNHWKDVLNGVVAKKIFYAISQREKQNKDEFSIEDLHRFANVNIYDESTAMLGALVIMCDPENGYLVMSRVFKDTTGKEFIIDANKNPLKYEYQVNGESLKVLKTMRHPETGKVIHNPEANMYLRFKLSNKFKDMLQQATVG